MKITGGFLDDEGKVQGRSRMSNKNKHEWYFIVFELLFQIPF